MTFLLLTGLPRSGTTLAAALLDRMDDTVCLSEPDEHLMLMRSSRDAADFVVKLYDSLEKTKRRLMAGEPILNRVSPDGTAVTDYFAEPDPDGRRPATSAIRPVSQGKFAADMFVCAKHNALYAAVLPELIRAKTFHIVAMVRDPVAVLRSWRSLKLPVSEGKLPFADRYWPDMRRLTADNIPLLTKQLRIYDLFCQRFIACRQGISLLKYEDLRDDCATIARPSPTRPAGQYRRSSA